MPSSIGGCHLVGGACVGDEARLLSGYGGRWVPLLSPLSGVERARDPVRLAESVGRHVAGGCTPNENTSGSKPGGVLCVSDVSMKRFLFLSTDPPPV